MLANGYLGMLISHILRRTVIITTGNIAAMYLFRKSRFPPSWGCNYKLTKIIVVTYHKSKFAILTKRRTLLIFYLGIIFRNKIKNSIIKSGHLLIIKGI